MRLRALFVVPVLLVGGVAVPAFAATAPALGYVSVAGSGPGDLVRVTGAGFRPGVAAAVTLGDGATTVALATAAADSAGAVALPAGTRIPLSVAPGDYRLTVTQAGDVTAVSPEFTIEAPSVVFTSVVTPGQPLDPVYLGTRVFVHGLANTPDVTRTVTVDGRPCEVVWFGDDRAFGRPDVGFSVPAGLTVGPHTITFAQTGPTPYSTSGSVTVRAPSLVHPARTGIRPVLPLAIQSTSWNDDFDVTIVGAAGDRHTGMRWTRKTVPDSTTTTTPSVRPTGTVSVGRATVTVVSRANGATTSDTVLVEPSGVAAPKSLGPDGWLASPDGRSLLVMETSGNLVEFVDGSPFWTTRTADHPGARLTVQTDGNVVVRGTDGHALWNSGTAGGGTGAHLGFDASDTPVLVLGNRRTAWSTFSPDGHRVVAGTLRAGSYLFQGQMLSNTPRAERPYSITLRLQTDGNVILDAYTSSNVWSTHTAGHPGAYLVLQTDGNLVLRAANGATLWANGVHGVSGALLTSQYNGDLAEFAPGGRLLWHTGTRGTFPSS